MYFWNFLTIFGSSNDIYGPILALIKNELQNYNLNEGNLLIEVII